MSEPFGELQQSSFQDRGGHAYYHSPSSEKGSLEDIRGYVCQTEL